MSDGLFIWCEQGRMLRPLLVVSELKRLTSVLAHVPTLNLWDFLLQHGIIEHVQKDEEHRFCTVAVRARDVLENVHINYTHLEIDPAREYFELLHCCSPMQTAIKHPDIYNAVMQFFFFKAS